MDNVKMKFCRVINAIYSKRKVSILKWSLLS